MSELNDNNTEDFLGTGFGKDVISAYVGNNSDYYLGKWEKASRPEAKAGWNWAASLAGPFWLGYRKMYREIGLILIFYLFTDVIQYLLRIDMNNAIGVAVGVMMGLYGNAYYFTHMKKQLILLKSSVANTETLIEEAGKKGGVSWKGVGVATLILLIYMALNIMLGYVLELT